MSLIGSYTRYPSLDTVWLQCQIWGPYCLRVKQEGCLYNFYDGPWYDPTGREPITFYVRGSHLDAIITQVNCWSPTCRYVCKVKPMIHGPTCRKRHIGYDKICWTKLLNKYQPNLEFSNIKCFCFSNYHLMKNENYSTADIYGKT